MKPRTKKPITMTKVNTINTHFTHIFTVLTAIILLYEGFHIREGSIIKVVSFIVVTALFYRYTKRTKLQAEEIEECKRETFYVQRTQERRISYSILILICIFCITNVISISSRRPSWEYKSDKRAWEKELYGLEAIPDAIPKGADKITYYCAEPPKFFLTPFIPSFYIRYILNDKDYEQAKKEIIKQGTLEELVGQHGVFHLEPEDIKQHYKDYQTYLFYEDYEHNTSGVMLNDNKRELCYFYARYWHDIIETDMPDLDE